MNILKQNKAQFKKDFEPFKIGTIFNPLKRSFNCKPLHKEVLIKYPLRLNAMALDPSKITENNNLVFTPGEIVFSIAKFTIVKLKLTSKGIRINSKIGRESIIKHSALIMKKTMGYKGGFYIEADSELDIAHIGIGSSGSLMCAVISAINELFGKPISKKEIIPFLPKDYKTLDSKKALELEKKNFPLFLKTGRTYSREIAYRMIHEVLPSLSDNRLDIIGNLIYDYRYKMGSIKNCSFCYSNLENLAENLSAIKKMGLAEILSLSSVGPSFFAITKNQAACKRIFEENGLKVWTTKPYNRKYKASYE
ncbi:MAG: hypothetical protein UT66_C0004G0038 [candidate division CPR2 bacterium GW2011_GWC1_39_9]|nr:MAG: hypothetical protein UT66_C0004G0038 [candidate division CPR2 bacterium GW2011_GWC1_39_9]